MVASKRRGLHDAEVSGAALSGSHARKKQKTLKSATTNSNSAPTSGQKLSSGPKAILESSHEQPQTIRGASLNTSSPGAGPSQPRSPRREPEKDSLTKELKGKRDRMKSTNKDGPSPKPKSKIRKLAPPRPFPTVPTSMSATGPRSSHTEGKNYICITRKTSLGMYLRRCKDIILKDGYKTLHLHAMGAAIPHLSRLVASLPSILPFSPDEMRSEIFTGTAEMRDEVIPDDEKEDIVLQTRGKSTMRVVFRIGDEEKAGEQQSKSKASKKNRKRKQKPVDDKKETEVESGPQELVFTEGDLDEQDLDDE